MFETVGALVAPFAGAWIEMFLAVEKWYGQRVAPFAGAWIEISFAQSLSAYPLVAPFAGAWIEIMLCTCAAIAELASLPSRERGLKSRA